MNRIAAVLRIMGICVRVLVGAPAIAIIMIIKFVAGLLMCIAYPFELLRLLLTRKEINWGKSMYIPSGLKFAICPITFEL